MFKCLGVPAGPPVKGVPNFLDGVLLYSPLIGGPPVFSEGVRICDAGVVGVKNPLTGLLPLEGPVGVFAELAVLKERFNLVGDITRFDC